MKKLAEIAAYLDATVIGDDQCRISRISAIQNATSQSIAFLDNAKYVKYLADTQAAAVILNPTLAESYTGNAIVCDNPYLAYAKLSVWFDESAQPRKVGIANTAVVHSSVIVSENVYIGENVVVEEDVILSEGVQLYPGCVIGKGSVIGENSKLFANVTLYHSSQVGENCIIHSGAVIGADGFGFAPYQGKWHKIAQLGRVVIGDNVEIGASTTIDRGAIEDTIIGDDCIIDNQVQIAHNVKIGKGTAIAGCTVVAGSTSIGNYCVIAGACAITGHVSIADKVQVSGMSMITKSILQSGSYSSGIPAEDTSTWRKQVSRYRRLDKLEQRIKRLEKL